MKAIGVAPRVAAIFLSIALSLPQSAWALKPTETQESTGLEELAEALLNPKAVIQRATQILFPATDESAAGLEGERLNVNEATYEELRQYFHALAEEGIVLHSLHPIQRQRMTLAIVEERKNGSFKDRQDFIHRMSGKVRGVHDDFWRGLVEDKYVEVWSTKEAILKGAAWGTVVAILLGMATWSWVALRQQAVAPERPQPETPQQVIPLEKPTEPLEPEPSVTQPPDKFDPKRIRPYREFQEEVGYSIPSKDEIQKMLQRFVDELHGTGFQEFSPKDFDHGHLVYSVSLSVYRREGPPEPGEVKLIALLYHTYEFSGDLELVKEKRSWIQWYRPDEVQSPEPASRYVGERSLVDGIEMEPSSSFKEGMKRFDQFGTVELGLLNPDSFGLHKETGLRGGVGIQFMSVDPSRLPLSLQETDNVIQVALPDGRTVHLVVSYRKAGLEALHTLQGHTDKVLSVAFSPDGRTVASGSANGTVRFWDSETGEPLNLQISSGSKVRSVAFSPNRLTFASAGEDGVITLWNSQGKNLRTLKSSDTDGKVRLTFSPDGQTLFSVSFLGTVEWWDLSTGQSLSTLRRQARFLSGAVFKPNGELLTITSVDQGKRLWLEEISGTGTPAGYLQDPGTRPLKTSAFSPDGEWVASVDHTETIRVWKASPKAKPSLYLKGHTEPVTSIAFSPNGAVLAAASHDGTIRLWRMPDGAPLQVLRGHAGEVTSIAFSPDGRTLASASFDHTVKLWDTSSLEQVVVRAVPPGADALGNSTAAGLEESEAQFIRRIGTETSARYGGILVELAEGFQKAARTSNWQEWMRTIEQSAERLEQRGLGFQEFAQRTGSPWSRDPRWLLYEQTFRFNMRAFFQKIHRVSVSLVTYQQLGKLDPRASFVLTDTSLMLLKGLAALVLKPSRANGIPPVSSSLTGEEWERLLRLQDEEWKFFGPLGKISLPAVIEFESGVFVPSATQVSAELMKEAGVNGTSFLYDPGAGIGSALVNAGVFFGARGFGREVIPELAGLAQRWIAHLESHQVGLLRPGQVQVEMGDAFSVSPEGLTHIYSFPPASDVYYRAFNDWVIRESPRMAPGAKIIILPEDTLLNRSFQQVFPAIASSGAWRTLKYDQKGIILEHHAAGLESSQSRPFEWVSINEVREDIQQAIQGLPSLVQRGRLEQSLERIKGLRGTYKNLNPSEEFVLTMLEAQYLHASADRTNDSGLLDQAIEKFERLRDHPVQKRPRAAQDQAAFHFATAQAYTERGIRTQSQDVEDLYKALADYNMGIAIADAGEVYISDTVFHNVEVIERSLQNTAGLEEIKGKKRAWLFALAFLGVSAVGGLAGRWALQHFSAPAPPEIKSQDWKTMSALLHYVQKVAAQSGDPDRAFFYISVKGLEDIESVLDASPKQGEVVRGLHALQFGPGLLYHGRDGFLEALRDGQIEGEAYFTRVGHQWVHLGMDKGDKSPAVFVMEAATFNRYMAGGKATLKIDGDREFFETSPVSTVIDPFPKTNVPVSLSDFKEFWVTEEAFKRYQEIAAGELGGHEDPRVVANLRLLLEQGKIKAIPGLRDATFDPASPLHIESEFFEKMGDYMVTRDLLKEIPVFESRLLHKGDAIIKDLKFSGDEPQVIGQGSAIAAHGHLLVLLQKGFRVLPDFDEIRWIEVSTDDSQKAKEAIQTFTMQGETSQKLLVLDKLLLNEPELNGILPNPHLPVFLVDAVSAQLLTPAMAKLVMELQLPPNHVFLLELRQEEPGQTLLNISV